MLERLSTNQQAVIGLVAMALIVVAATFGIKAAFGEYDSGYQLTARFEEAGQNLDTQSDVKIRGVNVGTVSGIAVGRDGRAIVTLHIDPDTDVPTSSIAAIRPISIFGPKFVDLVPGEGEGAGPYYEDGDEITHTESALELSDVLAHANELLEAVHPEDLTTILRTFADGVDGLEGPLASTVEDGQTLLDATIASTEDRHALLDSMAALSGELADRGDTIVALAENSRAPFRTLATQEDDLAGLLDGTARLSADLADVLDQNRDLLGPATASAADLSGMTASQLDGLVAYLGFVDNYGDVISRVIRIPSTSANYLLATQQFLLGSDPCRALVVVPDCRLPTIDPGTQVTDAG
jgi:phospholipid/cholesterol/gamma-HCH transport system substrate-binding protein